MGDPDDQAIHPADGLREVEQIRETLGIDDDQNIAYAEIRTNNEREELIAVSGYQSPEGTVPLPETRLFVTFDVDFDRSADAEVKLLETIAQRIQQQTEESGNDLSGVVVRLFTEREPCDSCEAVMVQFRAEFPPGSVALLVSDGEE